MLRELAARAGLPTVPVPHYVPSGVVNAFATGSKHHAAIALTDGLLRSLTPRELTGVLGHEIAHIANEDLRVMGLADSISRLTHLLALLGQLAIVLSLPTLLLGVTEVNWPALLLLAVAPQLALLAQLGLSSGARIRRRPARCRIDRRPARAGLSARQDRAGEPLTARGCCPDGAIRNPHGCARIQRRLNALSAC